MSLVLVVSLAFTELSLGLNVGNEEPRIIERNRMRIQKVLVLTPSLKRVGGVQRYTATLIATLEAILGVDHVLTIEVPGEPEARHNGNNALRSSVKLRFLVNALRTTVLWRPDLLICAHLGTARAALFIRKFTGVPYWLLVHGIEAWADLTPGRRRALRSAQLLIGLTRFSLDATVSRHMLGTPASVVLPPALEAVTALPADRLRVSKDPVVLTVGRLAASEKYKGHDVILDAWPAVLRRVPNAVYCIVGDGDDRQRLESRVRDMGIAASVQFAGTLSGNELSACYDRCRVFAMPARTELTGKNPRGEGFGIVFLEAMAHGKPVVAPRDGAPAEFIHSGEHGWLIDPTDPADVAQALIQLLENPQHAEHMGQAARDWVQQQFSPGKLRERLSQALQHESS